MLCFANHTHVAANGESLQLKKCIGSCQKQVAGEGFSVREGELAAGGDSEPSRAGCSLARTQTHSTHRS